MVDCPERLRNRPLFPAISLGSRDAHRVKVNLGAERFRFDISQYMLNNHYLKIYKEINTFGS